MSIGDSLHSQNRPPTGLHETLHDLVIQDDMAREGYKANAAVCAEFGLSMGGEIFPFIVNKLREDPELYKNLLGRLRDLNLDDECKYDGCSSGSLLYSIGSDFLLRISGDMYQEPTFDPLPLPLLKPAYHEVVRGEHSEVSIRVSSRLISFTNEERGFESQKRMLATDTMRGLGYVQPGQAQVKIGYFALDEDKIPLITTLGPWKEQEKTNVAWIERQRDQQAQIAENRIQLWEGRHELYCPEMNIADPLERLEAITSEARFSRNNDELL